MDTYQQLLTNIYCNWHIHLQAIWTYYSTESVQRLITLKGALNTKIHIDA